MSPDGMWSIGELAEHAGVTVKTVRFYSDRGLLPEAVRSAGGHRRYGPDALDRLRLIRSLRTLDLSVTEAGRVLDRDDALEDVIAGRLREVGSQLTALRWREAALQLLRDCTVEERTERLRLIGAIGTPPSTAALARFWRRTLPARFPARLAAAVLDAAVPQPPADPTPAQVLTFARLHALVSGPRHRAVECRPVFLLPDAEYRPAVLYEGLGEAYALASADLRARRSPRGGEALDCFVSAYAGSRGTRDTPAFRRRLPGLLPPGTDQVIGRYWELAAELSAPPSGPAEPTAGAAHSWLCAALKTRAGRPAPAPDGRTA